MNTESDELFEDTGLVRPARRVAGHVVDGVDHGLIAPESGSVGSDEALAATAALRKAADFDQLQLDGDQWREMARRLDFEVRKLSGRFDRIQRQVTNLSDEIEDLRDTKKYPAGTFRSLTAVVEKMAVTARYENDLVKGDEDPSTFRGRDGALP